MLSASLPIFNRLSADQLFCRLIEPFVGIKNESSFSNSSPPQTSSKGQKFSEKGIRERSTQLIWSLTELTKMFFKDILRSGEPPLLTSAI